MKNNDVQKFIRKDLQDWESYSAGDSAWELAKRFDITVENLIKLNANENPYGPSPLAKKAIAQQKWYNYYPGDSYNELRTTIASYASVSTEQIVVGTGSDEIIDLLLRLTIETGDSIINCPPTFSMYPLYATLNRAKVITVQRNKDYSLNSEAIEKSITKKTKMIFIANPNNPTGSLTPLSEIESLLKTNILVVVDEAYFEFSKETAVPLLKRYPHLIILRTFSKWAGLAGLRLGYAMMNPFLAEKLNAIKSPFNVNLAAETAVIATLADTSFTQKNIKKIITERERIYEILQTFSDISVFPSNGNFLFLQLKNGKYKELKNIFEKNKCAIRFYDSSFSGQGIRFTIGKPSQNNIVIKVLKEFCNE